MPWSTRSFLLIQRGEVGQGAGAQVFAGALHPQTPPRPARSRGSFLHQLRRGIPAAGVGNPLVGAEDVAAVAQALHGVELIGDLVIP